MTAGSSAAPTERALPFFKPCRNKGGQRGGGRTVGLGVPSAGGTSTTSKRRLTQADHPEAVADALRRNQLDWERSQEEVFHHVKTPSHRSPRRCGGCLATHKKAHVEVLAATTATDRDLGPLIAYIFNHLQGGQSLPPRPHNRQSKNDCR